MATMFLANTSVVTQKIFVEFPNLFSGFKVTYSRGFNLFGLSIYWYGMLIALGLVLAYLYAMHRMEKDFGIVKDRAFDVVFAAVIGGFLCARIYYCVFTTLNPDSPTNYNFITTFTTIHDGGIAIYGGIIGAVLTGLIFCKIRKIKFFAMADIAALGFLIGQCIGRWGNFVNQEAYGEACDKDWLFAMTGTRIANEMGEGVCVHPCFLYESVWCLIGFMLLHLYSKKLRSFDGEIALLYVAWYGLGRFFIEGLRTDSLMAGQFRVSQLVAAVSFAAAVILYVVFKILSKKKSWILYVNSDASKELMEHDRLVEAERAAKKKSKKNPESDAFAENSNANENITQNVEADVIASDNHASCDAEQSDDTAAPDTVENTPNTEEEKENENGTDN